MKRTSVIVAAAGAAFALLGSSPANAYHATVQAENGRIDNANCGDDGPMAYQNTVVFHPGSGCSQTFNQLLGTGPLDTIRYYMTGLSGTMCGHFEVSGAYSGRTAMVCNTGGWTTGVWTTPIRYGINYTITWRTDSGTPTWVNAYVDYHTLH